MVIRGGKRGGGGKEVGAHIILLCGALHMLQKFQVSYPNHTRAASLHMSRNFRLARRYFICF